MYFKKDSTTRFARNSIGLLTAILIAGCTPVEDITPIDTPRMTMDLPISLSAIVSAAEETTASSKPNISSQTRLESSDAPTDLSQCEKYLDKDANFMENGYNMTRFLVGLSQQQSCFADFIMNALAIQGATWVNKGIIALPANPTDPDSASHAQIERTGDKIEIWLFFGTIGTDLPADKSDMQTLYLTWSGVDEDITGQFLMVNFPIDAAKPDEPSGLRVDFVRTATSAENKIYIELRDTHSAKLSGFRIDVSQVGPVATATYYAKGLMTFSEQPFTELPAGLALPDFSVSAVVDSEGVGASVANFTNFSLSLIADGNKDGVIDSTAPLYEFDLGSYQFNIVDKTYFDPSLNDTTDTVTPFINQVTEWRNKSANNAIFVSDTPRIIPDPNYVYSMYNCLEGATDFICDYDLNGIMNDAEWLGWGLGDNYFSEVCIDDASITSDCTAFIDTSFAKGEFGSNTLNSTGAEPSDWRITALNDLTQLTTVNPDDDTTGATTFTIPAPPTR